jgi:hypothetical protein
MSIVATELSSVIGDADKQRVAFYRCQDHLGEWHRYGPVVINSLDFDLDAFKTVVAVRVAGQLAESEANEVLG